MCQYVIELTGLTKKYGDFTAVNDLNLQIRKGEIFGLLGPNGAGKSTTILMMLGLTEPTTGSVKVCDIDSTTHPIEVKRKVGYLPEDVGFYEDMTGIENLVYTAALNGIRRKEARAKAERLLDRIGLVKEADKKAGKYSKGMRQRLGLADVLIKQVCDRVGLFGGGKLLAEVELTDLHKTEHGLDHIYNQYFGGGRGHE